MAGFFAIPNEARTICGTNPGRRALVMYLYDRADQRRWAPFAFTDRELADASGLSRHGVWSLLEDLEAEGLATIRRATPSTKERSELTLRSPLPSVASESGQNSGQNPGQNPARTPARTMQETPVESEEPGQNSGQNPARTPASTPATRAEKSRARSDYRPQTTDLRPQTESVTLPAWARKASVPPGTDRHLLMEVVVEARNGVVGTPANPDACGTASKSVLALWKALGHPDLQSFRTDLLLVVEAAKDCPDRVFARDIRAEGWPDGVDRSRDIDTICRHGKWDLRLEAARRWDRTGRRTAAAREVWEPEPAAPADDAPTYLRLDPDTQRAIVARAAMSGETFSNALLERLSIEHIGETP